MKWDISDHCENQSEISFNGNHKYIVKDKLSSMFIVNDKTVGELHPFAADEDREGIDTISRRWYLTITDLPDDAKAGNRSVQATFYGSDDSPDSVLDGSTFGEISIFEVSPHGNPNHIVLVVDFTKVRSQQDHKFGIHVLITHGAKIGDAVSGDPNEDV